MGKSRKKKRARSGADPLVSCVLPAGDRPELAIGAMRCYQQQDYPNRELLIVHGGGGNPERRLPPDASIRSVELPEGVPLATQRDYACHLAQGEFFAWWDGRDWSGPGRLTAQLAPLLAGEADISALDGDARTLVFHRTIWERQTGRAHPLEEAAFLEQALASGARLRTLPGEGLYAPAPARSGWRPLVTCIMPTADRPALVPHAIRQFLAQDYPERELLVLDAGRQPVAGLIPPGGRIRYLRAGERMSLGALRNLACREARGQLIAHWDDDDWMAPSRLSYQVEELLRHGADLCGLDRLYFVDWAARRAWEYCYPADDAPWVAGGTLCYWKEFWQRNPFPDISVGEDNTFVWTPAPKRLLRLEDRRFYVASVHRRNTSPKIIAPDRWHERPFEEARALVGPGWSEYAQALAGNAPRPLVSCVMATRDRPGFVRQALRCFLRQTYRPAELLVVDDGAEPVAELCRGLLNVRYLRCPAPMTLGAKLNWGIQQARGEIVQKIDDDDHYGPDFLAQAAAALEDVPPGGGVVAWCCFLVLLPGEEVPRFSGHGWAAGATLCFHRALWERTRFRDVPREVDRCFLEDAGVEVRRVCAPESLLVVRHGAHTWERVEGATVEDYFRALPRYHLPVADLVEPIDRGFYESLIRNG